MRIRGAKANSPTAPASDAAVDRERDGISADLRRCLDAAREHAGDRPAGNAGGIPTTHYIMLSEAILFRGAGLPVVWLQLLALATIGAALFGLSLAQFRKAVATMG